MDQVGLMNTHVYIHGRTKKLVMGLLRPVLAAVSAAAVAHFLYKRLFGQQKAGLLKSR